MSNVSKINELPISIKSNVLKSLICLSKWLNCYTEFTKAFKNSGVKWIKTDAFSGFLNIVNGHHEDLEEWYKTAVKVLPENYALFLEFTLRTGLRRNESITAFNMVRELAEENKLSSYYNSELSMLENYKFPKTYLRHTKNSFVSCLSIEVINKVIKARKVYYTTLRKDLAKNRLKLRIKELRSYNNSYLRKNGILAELVDLHSGRVPSSVFCRNYFKETLADLSKQILPLQDKMIESLS